jgi:capsular polysaccharide biosynthesis protein
VEGRLYLRLLMRHLVLLVVVLVLAGAAGAGLYAMAEPRYRSSVVFAVQSDAHSTEPSEVYQAELLSQARAQTYASLFTGEDVAARLSPGLPADVSDRRIRGDLSAAAAVGSVLVRMTVTDRDRAVVHALTDGLVEELPAYVEELQPSGTERVTALALAGRPAAVERVAPTKTRYGGLALLGGLLAGFLLAALRETGNRRVRDSDDARAVLGSSVVVVDFPLRSPRRRQAERAPVLLSKVLAVAGVRRQPVLLVAVNGGRRSAAQALELGRRLSTPEHRVVLVDLDLETRALSALAESTNPQLVVHELEGAGAPPARANPPSVRVVPAEVVEKQAVSGGAGRHRSEPLASALGKVNDQLRPAADTVMVFLGTVLRRSRPAMRQDDRHDAIVLAERGRTSKEALTATVDVLGLLGAHVGAVVLVDAAPRRLG